MKKIFKLLSAIIITGNLTGCLKDKPIDNYADLDPVILIPNANWPSAVSMVRAVEIPADATSVQLKVYARVSWKKPLDQDCKVKFIVNGELITQYNQAASAAYELLPESAYEMPGLMLTIPAGKQEAYIPVNIEVSKMDLTKNYMLAFSINDAGGEKVAENFRSILFPLVIK